MEITGKVGLITGGAYGIGKKLAETFLEKGAKGVIILDINDKHGDETQKELNDKFGSGKCFYLKCDVTKKDEVKAGFELAKSRYGRVDIVCNNAGLWDEVNWEKMFQVNINGVIYGTQLGIEYLEEAGVIVNTASVAGLSLVPFAPMYATTKVAVIGFSRNMAHFEPSALKKKIRINCVCPSAVGETNLLPSTRVEERNKELFTAFMKAWPLITTDDVAKAFVKAIEEDHNGQALFIPALGKDIVVVEDETSRFRQGTLGVEIDAAFHAVVATPE